MHEGVSEARQVENSLAIPGPNGYKIEGISHPFQVILFQLQPMGASLAGLIGAVKGLDYQAFGAHIHCLIQEGGQLLELP